MSSHTFVLSVIISVGYAEHDGGCPSVPGVNIVKMVQEDYSKRMPKDPPERGVTIANHVTTSLTAFTSLLGQAGELWTTAGH